MSLRNIIQFLIEMGGPGSGNWGHVGDPPRRGGSSPSVNVTKLNGEERHPRLSLKTGRDAKRRQQNARNRDTQFFKGNLKTSSMEEIYAGSSEEIRKLADETGVIAVDRASFEYVTKKLKVEQEKNKQDPLKSLWVGNSYTSSGVASTVESVIDNNYTDIGRYNAVLSMKEAGMNPTPVQLLHFQSIVSESTNYRFRFNDIGRTYTDEEQAVFSRLESFTLKNGKLGVKGQKYVSTLKPGNPDYDVMLNLINESYSKKAIVQITSQAVADIERIQTFQLNNPDKKFTSDYDNMVNLSDYHTRVNTIIQIRNQSNFVRNPSKPLAQDLADYSMELLKKNGVPLPEKVTIVKPKFKTPDLIALSSVSAQEKQDQIDSIKNSHDPIAHGKFTTEVNNVFYVKNSGKTEAAYRKAIDTYGQNTEMRGMIHATSVVAGPLISSGGYRASSTGMLGQGVYVTNISSKAAAYLAGGANTFSHNGIQDGTMLVNRTLMGKQGTYQNNDHNRHNVKFDSIFGKKGTKSPVSGSMILKNDEWVVRDTNAVLPVYYIDVTRKPTY